jgi:Cdc6-like AAA superfamily ATPase
LSISSEDVNRLISTTIERNPRRLKRFLSDLKIKAQLVQTRNLLMKSDVLVKMSCIAYTWKDFWLNAIETPSIFERAQKIALSPSDNEKTPDDIDFMKSYHVNERLLAFLRTQPLVSDADLQEYVFLSNTTSATIQDNNESGKRKRIKTQIRFSDILSDRPLSDLFIGREREISQALDAIKRGVPLILIKGERGSGKTALLMMIDRLAQNDFVPTLVNLQGFLGYAEDTQTWFYEMARQVIQSVNSKGYKFRFKPVKDKFSLKDFEDLLSRVTSSLKGKRLVLMLDEYEVLEASINTERLDRDFLSSLRYLLTNNQNITLILSGKHGLDNLSPTLWSPLANLVGLTIHLGGFTENEIYHLLLKRFPQNRVDTRMIEYLIKMTNGNPRMLLMLVSNLPGKLVELSPDNLLNIKDADKRMEDDASPMFETLFRSMYSDSQIRLSKNIADILGSKSISEIPVDELCNVLQQKDPSIDGYSVIDNLINDGILSSDAKTSNIRFSNALFYSWLNSRPS